MHDPHPICGLTLNDDDGSTLRPAEFLGGLSLGPFNPLRVASGPDRQRGALKQQLNFEDRDGFAICSDAARLAPNGQSRSGVRRASARIPVKKLEPLYTVAETAKILNVCEKTVRRLIKNEFLRAIDVRRGIAARALWRVVPADLEDFIRDHRSR